MQSSYYPMQGLFTPEECRGLQGSVAWLAGTSVKKYVRSGNICLRVIKSVIEVHIKYPSMHGLCVECIFQIQIKHHCTADLHTNNRMPSDTSGQPCHKRTRICPRYYYTESITFTQCLTRPNKVAWKTGSDCYELQVEPSKRPENPDQRGQCFRKRDWTGLVRIR